MTTICFLGCVSLGRLISIPTTTYFRLSPDTDIQSHLNKVQIHHKTRFIIAKLFHES